MKSMGFETGAYKIDGHIKNGWKISASNPNGENIDFTKVFMDDAGKMNIEIDHKTLGDLKTIKKNKKKKRCLKKRLER